MLKTILKTSLISIIASSVIYAQEDNLDIKSGWQLKGSDSGFNLTDFNKRYFFLRNNRLHT